MRTSNTDRCQPNNKVLGNTNEINSKRFQISYNEQFKTSIKTTQIKI